MIPTKLGLKIPMNLIRLIPQNAFNTKIILGILGLLKIVVSVSGSGLQAHLDVRQLLVH